MSQIRLSAIASILFLTSTAGGASVHYRPQYPQVAIDKCIEGYVILRFRVSEEGIPKDIEVIEASPKGIFEKEAKKVISKWIQTEGHGTVKEQKLEFKLEDPCKKKEQ